MINRRIFVSYRRADCAAHAGWLVDTLRRNDVGEVFLNVDTISLGEDFVKQIAREIERCDVVLVLIGREWLTVEDEVGQPRILDELDYVHLEVKAALDRGVPVVPVLVEGTQMPRPQQLPEPVRPLAYRAGIELRESSWNVDVGRLIAQLPVPRSPQTQPLQPEEATPGSQPDGSQATPQQRTGRGAKIEWVQEMAQDAGVGDVLDAFIQAAAELGLRIKPWPKSLTIVPPFTRGRTLLYLAPKADGILHVGHDTDNIVELYGAEPTEVREALGQNWVDLTDVQARSLLEGFVSLMQRLQQAQQA